MGREKAISHSRMDNMRTQARSPRAGRGRLQRGFSIIESLLAMVLLVLMLLAWGSAMISATQGENKAANHTQTVAIANQILEYMRRDPYFWSPSEFVSSSCPTCWPATYNDTPGSGAHPCSMVIPGAPAACTFNWLARAAPNSNNDLAQLTVIVYYQGANHQTETYTVMGMARNL